jgi:hypothetical protein
MRSSQAEREFGSVSIVFLLRMHPLLFPFNNRLSPWVCGHWKWRLVVDLMVPLSD